jgi:hypothetical protein
VKGAPRLDPAMRELLRDHHNETFEEGRQAGRREMEEEFTGSGIITLAIGGILGGLATLGIQAAYRALLPLWQ